MPLPPTVLVVTAPDDLGADLVIRQIQDHGVAVHRIDPADLARPGVLRMTGVSDGEPLRFTIEDDHRCTLSQSIVSVFWWHPGPPVGWEQQESRTILEEYLYGLDGVLWVNHPLRAVQARPGPRQLKLASSLGLRTPPALFTNDPNRAAEFARKQGGKVVCKTLVAHPNRFIQARLVTAEEIRASADHVRQALCYLQRPVDKTHDIRLTVIGDRMFPCKVTANGAFDWRVVPEGELGFEAVAAGRPLTHKVQQLMNALGLEYAALDFAVDRGGTWWFLEANPAGQFGFIQAATGMVISRAIADHLTQAAMAPRTFTPDGGHRASSRPGPGRRKTAGA
ncbi:hypothetical protein JL475_30025 [Streptomyces sp. M2CJ-2]|uniref:hypothetical protein n=1 Tax=Streptomyces sp. M2CJ-2 TaxID=2803948 RepID=UPI001925D915|nr:hypothetical protein [Streptomyces sp. M2CJ-2]MBL3670143.1 hypothetical protein [Streptomyces sp. M2CJ-2]